MLMILCLYIYLIIMATNTFQHLIIVFKRFSRITFYFKMYSNNVSVLTRLSRRDEST